MNNLKKKVMLIQNKLMVTKRDDRVEGGINY